jgi:MFS family permease
MPSEMLNDPCSDCGVDVVTAQNPVPAYLAVTAAYWAFMLTDGALRMLVLLHFNALGFSPIQLAWLFLFYEAAGVITNLGAGWLAARFGLASTLYAGLVLQIGAILALAQLDPGWGVAASVGYVMAVQGVSGVAKDLAKMAAKSAVKILAPDSEGNLFRWVALLTGSKNAVKGLGFFLGAALLGMAGFHAALRGMAGVLALILLAVVLFLAVGLPVRNSSAKLGAMWSPDRRINRLSLALIAAEPTLWFTFALVLGLLLFGYVFAINSSVHSYLILALSDANRVTREVGIYHSANAVGRLARAILSGISYQLGGLPLCLATSGLMALASWLAMRRLLPAGDQAGN